MNMWNGKPSDWLILLIASLLLAACSGEKPTIKIGYVGSLTGRTADLGTAGRNGVQVAVDQLNAAGGINGRKIELIIRDDGNDAEAAKMVVRELVNTKVEAILGPMTSNMAMAMVPVADEAKMLIMGGSVTTNDLTGKDDMFFRAIAPSTVHAGAMAEFLYASRGARRVSLIVNMSNKAYTESWFNNFSQTFGKLGGSVLKRVDYLSTTETDFIGLSKELMTGAPDAVVLITNAVDASLFANQFRLQKSRALVATSEWAGTGKLTEIGGANVEGFIVAQYIDPQSTVPEFIAFRDAYRQRFQQDVGFPPVIAFNAAQILLRALASQKPDEHLKQTLLRLRTFSGLQGEQLEFDDFGDVQTKTFLTEVRNGQYHLIR